MSKLSRSSRTPSFKNEGLSSCAIFVCGAAILAAGLLAAGWWVGFRRAPVVVEEPQYGGRTVSEWLYQLAQGAPEQACGAFRELGKEAVPVLLSKVKENRIAPAERLYGAVWERLPTTLAERLRRPRQHDQFLVDRVAVAFSHIGSSAMPQLIDALDDENVDTRLAVIKAIGFLAAVGEVDRFRSNTVRKLTQLEAARNASVRTAASNALSEVARTQSAQ